MGLQPIYIGQIKPINGIPIEGDEVFVVLDGQVKMLYRVNGEKTSVLLNEGDIFYATEGVEHVAHPVGEARVLVIEKEGSV